MDAQPDLGELAHGVVADLGRRGLTLATCESLTGGLVGATITAVPGSSAVYVGGLVTYASRLKHQLAGVDEALIAEHGVVNRACAEQMATGARRLLAADLALACTGVAGPDPQDGERPGTVWIALATPDGVVARRLALVGDREAVRRGTVAALFALVHEHLA